MKRIAAQYALLRSFVEDVTALEPPSRMDPEVKARGARILALIPPLAMANQLAAAVLPHCGVMWGEGKFASGVYIGNGMAMTAQHVMTSFRAAQATFRVGNASERFTNPCEVDCWMQRDDPVSDDIAVIKLKNTNLPALAELPLVTPDEFADLAAASAPVTVVGFGCGWPPGHPEQAAVGTKRGADIPIFNGNLRCIQNFDPRYAFLVADGDATGFCNGNASGLYYRSSCTMDSGGPAFATVGGKTKLVGLVTGSGTSEGASMSGCGLSQVSVLVRVDANLDMVQKFRCTNRY